MSMLGWVILGAIAGTIASAVMAEPHGFLGHILLGVVGALLGAFVSSIFGQQPLAGVNLASVSVAVVGTILLITVLRALRGPQVG